MNVHEIFSNSSELLQEIVSESEKVNIKLELHPSLVLKTTSPIGDPPQFFRGKPTPPSLETSLGTDLGMEIEDTSSPKSLSDPEGEGFTGWIPSPNKKGEFFPTEADNNPSTLPEASKKKKGKQLPLHNPSTIHFHEGEAQKTFFAPTLISPDLFISTQKSLKLLGANLHLKEGIFYMAPHNLKNILPVQPSILTLRKVVSILGLAWESVPRSSFLTVALKTALHGIHNVRSYSKKLRKIP